MNRMQMKTVILHLERELKDSTPNAKIQELVDRWCDLNKKYHGKDTLSWNPAQCIIELEKLIGGSDE